VALDPGRVAPVPVEAVASLPAAGAAAHVKFADVRRHFVPLYLNLERPITFRR
jgi:hypothetical protein